MKKKNTYTYLKHSKINSLTDMNVTLPVNVRVNKKAKVESRAKYIQRALYEQKLKHKVCSCNFDSPRSKGAWRRRRRKRRKRSSRSWKYRESQIFHLLFHTVLFKVFIGLAMEFRIRCGSFAHRPADTSGVVGTEMTQ